jgi:general secretion pathway protein D
VHRLLSTLDQPGAAGNIHVVYLKNAEAAKVAQTLRAVLSNNTNNVGALANAGSTVFGSVGANASTNTDAGAASAGGTGMVQADPATNALIITAPEPVYNDLRRVIDQLDRRRAQIYIEALIAEMTAENAAEFGIQWFAGDKTSKDGKSFVGGGTSFGTPTLLGAAADPTVLANASGLNIMAGKGTVTIGGVEILNLNILARFLATQSKANILSTPTLITLDNEEAKMVVGNQVPIVTGQYTNGMNTGATVNPFQTIERKDVGLTLKVKPQISEGGAVRLLISEETSSVDLATAANQNGPITRMRSIESTVLVDDGAIIALGGLMEDQSTDSASKVPFLGDLPLIGAAFRYDNKRRQKTNLVVFLRPKIIRTAEDYREITAARYDQHLQQQLQPEGSKNLLMPDFGPPPQLPEREQNPLTSHDVVPAQDPSRSTAEPTPRQ